MPGLPGSPPTDWTHLPSEPWLIAAFFVAAWLVHRLSSRLSGPILKITRWGNRAKVPTPQRLATLQGLVANTVALVALVAAILASLAMFVSADALLWTVGLFSAGFGLGARPLVSDVLTGVSLLFEDTFSVGEKVEIMGVEGVVEEVNLRTTLMRSPTGELFVVPNGEIRMVRNFSRGLYSSAKVTLSIRSADLPRALEFLLEHGSKAADALPAMLEPWQVLSEAGSLADNALLTLAAKTEFGQAAALKPRLLAYVQRELAAAGIETVG